MPPKPSDKKIASKPTVSIPTAIATTATATTSIPPVVMKAKTVSAVSTPSPPVAVVEKDEAASSPVASVTTSESSSSTKTMDTYIESLSEKLTNAMEMFKQINVDFRLLQKQYLREKKNLGKKVKNKGGAGAGTGGKISGFAKPGFISSELCDFLKVDHDTQLARTDVTKKITQYIKENNLQDPLNKRRLLLDKSLTTLLKPSEGQEVTYFNLQSFMKKHYEKPQTTVVSSST